MKKITQFVLMMLLLVTSAHADTPGFMVTFGEVFTDMATEVIIGLMILAIWVIAGFTAYFRSSGMPLKWAFVATVAVVAAPYIGGSTLMDWASTTFG